MMRLGRLLDEGNPEELLLRYQSLTLEDAFLQLCHKDGDTEISKFEDKEVNVRTSKILIQTSLIL